MSQEILKIETENINGELMIATNVNGTEEDIYRGMTCALQKPNVFVGTMIAVVGFCKKTGNVEMLHEIIDEIADTLKDEDLGDYSMIYDSTTDFRPVDKKIIA